MMGFNYFNNFSNLAVDILISSLESRNKYFSRHAFGIAHSFHHLNVHCVPTTNKYQVLRMKRQATFISSSSSLDSYDPPPDESVLEDCIPGYVTMQGNKGVHIGVKEVNQFGNELQDMMSTGFEMIVKSIQMVDTMIAQNKTR